MLRWTAVALLAAAPAAAHANPVSADPAKVPAGPYVLDARHASLVVKIPHMGGFSRYTFRFGRLSGGFDYDPAGWPTTKATIEVDAASVDTGDPAFDKTIAGFLDAKRSPRIVFVTTGVTPASDGDAGKVTGDLTLHGVTRPVTLEVTFNGYGPGLLGAGTRMGFSGVGHIRRTDFGVDAVRSFAGDDVDLIFDVEFVRQ